MKIALIDIPLLSGKESKKDIPSLTLGYLGAALLSAGHSVFILDTARWKKSYESCYEKIITERPEVLGFTCTTVTRFVTIELIRRIKKVFSPLIIVGGCHFTFTAKDALEKVGEIDIVVRGEGEETILEVLRAYANDKEYGNVSGITYRKDTCQVIENPDRSFNNFNRILPPAWELFDLSLYNDTLETTNLKVIGVMSSRGCPQRCAFCANSAIGKATLRLKNYITVVDEIERLQNKFGYNAFKFSDDTLTFNKTHIINICKEMLRRNLNIKWSARVRVNTVDEERLEYMKRAGCVSLLFGIESGSQKILRMMHKEIDLTQVKQAIRLSSALKFSLVGASFMISYPGEDFKDIDMSFTLMRELKSYGPNVKVVYGFTLIYPGTEVERIAYQEGVLPKDFSWNSFYRAPKYFIAQCEQTDVYYESKQHTLEEIKAYIASHYYSFGSGITKAFLLLGRMRNFENFSVLMGLLRNTAVSIYKKLIFRPAKH